MLKDFNAQAGAKLQNELALISSLDSFSTAQKVQNGHKDMQVN